MKKVELVEIQLEEIKSATNDFHDDNCIGGGGFGKVYEGSLTQFKEQSMVAIKRLDSRYGQGGVEYSKEIKFLSSYTHHNLISLLGFCKQGTEMILVYEHASRGSLDKHLNSADLTWKQRLQICLGAAKGLNYLHDPRETGQRLIHCDIKSANILLDDDWNAKVADFGLSKIAPANSQNSILVTNALGTPGYCDPEFIDTYRLTKESDVYSFGVVLFEVLCGQLCFEKTHGLLVSKWIKSYNEKSLDEIIFKDLRQNMDQNSLEIYSGIAFECLKRSRQERPAISFVVERLEAALECIRFKPPKEYEEILNAAVPPLTYESMEELRELLSKGFHVNNTKTIFSINDKKEHVLLISIKNTLVTSIFSVGPRYSHEYNSSFKVGTYSTGGERFKICVTPQYLSPCMTYEVNLVFKCPEVFKEKSRKQGYISLIYTLNFGEKRRSIVCIGDKSEDEWLRARLHQFTTTSDHNSIKDLKINFESHQLVNSLEIEGIEFQQLKVNAELNHDGDKYQEISKYMEPPALIYTSVQEFDLLLSKGLLLNGDNTWFSVDDKGQHCEFISIKHCIIPAKPGESYDYRHNNNSRFPVGTLYPLSCNFKVRVRPQLLTPLITYTLNLVFKFINEDHEEVQPKQPYIRLKYKLQGQTEASISYSADKTEIDEFWRVELCQFTSEQGTTTADLQITFEGCDPKIVVEGIEFLPVEYLEKVYLVTYYNQFLKDKHVDDDDIQPIISSSDSVDTYWEQKLPIGYEDIIKLAKDSVPMSTTKKELYLFLSKGFLINDGQEWLSLDKNGKKCLMLSPRVAIVEHNVKWKKFLSESRFEETMELTYKRDFKIACEIRSGLLSSETEYATYLVYQLPQRHQPLSECPMKVTDDRDLVSGDWKEWKKVDFWRFHLIAAGGVDVREGKVDGGTINTSSSNPLKRPKLKGIPKERRDGWMEVQIWEFKTPSEQIIIPIRLLSYGWDWLNGLIIQGIEFRPV